MQERVPEHRVSHSWHETHKPERASMHMFHLLIHDFLSFQFETRAMYPPTAQSATEPDSW